MDRNKRSSLKGLGNSDVPIGRVRPLNDKKKKATPVSIILKVVLAVVIFVFMLILMAGGPAGKRPDQGRDPYLLSEQCPYGRQLYWY